MQRKEVNDTYGHLVGDQVLVQLADLLTQELRTADEIARFGGEEFVVILPDVQASMAYAIAERLRQTVADTAMEVDLAQLTADRVADAPAEPLALHITISLGMALYPDQGDSLNTLLEFADKQLYAAKTNGRNQVKMA
jgi:diguanylate cyclase (GGDEF)-like protein